MIELRVRKELFREKCILGTIEAYKYITDVNLQDQSDYWILQFENCKFEENSTVREFENYLIGLENC